MLVIYVALTIIIVSAYLNYMRMKNYKKLYNGPDALPYIGNGHQFGLGSSIVLNCQTKCDNVADFFKTVNDFWKQYGTRFRVHIGHQLLLLLSDPKDVEGLLSSNSLIEKSVEYNFMKPWLGTGLLTSAGEKWRKHRKVITPTFHFKILEHFIQVFNSQSDVLINKLKPYVDKGSFDVFPHITLCALDIISESAMGVSIEAQNQSDSPYVTAVKDMLRVINGRMRNPLKRSDFLFMWDSDYWLQKRSLKLLHNFTDKMIQERKRLLNSQSQDFTSYVKSDEALGAKKKLAFLDMLLLSKIDGQPLSDLDIREEVDTFLFEGHDTTTSGITFSLYLIAHNPEIQKKLFEEQKDIFGSELDRDVTHDDLQNMKYLELAVKESLRLYPPVPFYSRRIPAETTINGMKIPAETTVVILAYNMQRNPEVFPDPEKFIPERFLPEETSKRNVFSMAAFSAGPRNCIGQKFAMLEMKSTISKIIRRYELLPSNEDLGLTADLILKPSNGAKIKIIDRKL